MTTEKTPANLAEHLTDLAARYLEQSRMPDNATTSAYLAGKSSAYAHASKLVSTLDSEVS